MISGFELFIGLKFEKDYGHILFIGQGGIYIETIQDLSYSLVPLNSEKCIKMIHSLRCYPIISGSRGMKSVCEDMLIQIMLKVSALVTEVPEIVEMDLNPLILTGNELLPVDIRIKLDR
jgi:acetyltransferase